MEPESSGPVIQDLLSAQGDSAVRIVSSGLIPGYFSLGHMLIYLWAGHIVAPSYWGRITTERIQTLLPIYLSLDFHVAMVPLCGKLYPRCSQLEISSRKFSDVVYPAAYAYRGTKYCIRMQGIMTTTGSL